MRCLALFVLVNFVEVIFCQPSGAPHSMSIPPSPYSCDTDNPDPKFFGESCKTDSDCYAADRSMVCLTGKCTCAEGFVPANRFLGEASVQKICVPAPYLFQPCDTACQKPAVCKDAEGQKVCQCDKPYRLVDGSCLLDCKNDESYDQNEAKCVPKCKKNEIKLKTGCKPLAGLGEKCEEYSQCTAAYAGCIGNKCSCLDGFTTKGSTCVPKIVTCVSGDALKKGDDYQICTFSEKNPGSKKPPPVVAVASEAKEAAAGAGARPFYGSSSGFKDDCPDTHYCFLTGGANLEANATGYCCPKVKADCPIGRPHSNASCEPSLGQNYCPSETHYCYSISLGSQSKQSCCPKSCTGNSLLVNGKCYPQVQLNDACITHEQCVDPLAECVNGKCSCPKDVKEVGGQLYKYCSKECSDTEIPYNNDCYPYLKRGESCSEQEWRCPPNSYCNKDHQCECQCGSFTLAQDVCAPAPVCPKPIRGFPMPLAAAEGGGRSLPKLPVRITEQKKKELLKNITFCTVKSKKAPKVDNTVNECPKGQYCASYIQNLGICCSLPEPICFDGSKPIAVKACDITNPLSCGPSATCIQYLSTADPDSSTGRICCKNQAQSPDGGVGIAEQGPPPPPPNQF